MNFLCIQLYHIIIILQPSDHSKCLQSCRSSIFVFFKTVQWPVHLLLPVHHVAPPTPSTPTRILLPLPLVLCILNPALACGSTSRLPAPHPHLLGLDFVIPCLPRFPAGAQQRRALRCRGVRRCPISSRGLRGVGKY
jgi:hypothetical protein